MKFKVTGWVETMDGDPDEMAQSIRSVLNDVERMPGVQYSDVQVEVVDEGPGAKARAALMGIAESDARAGAAIEGKRDPIITAQGWQGIEDKALWENRMPDAYDRMDENVRRTR